MDSNEEHHRPSSSQIQVRNIVKSTPLQKALLVQLLIDRPKLGTGRLHSDFSIQDRRRGWMEVAEIINSRGVGPVKSPKKWNKVWNDYKSLLKLKIIEMKKNGYDMQRFMARLSATEKLVAAHFLGVTEFLEADDYPLHDMFLEQSSMDTLTADPEPSNAIHEVHLKQEVEDVQEVQVTPDCQTLLSSSPNSPGDSPESQLCIEYSNHSHNEAMERLQVPRNCQSGTTGNLDLQVEDDGGTLSRRDTCNEGSRIKRRREMLSRDSSSNFSNNIPKFQHSFHKDDSSSSEPFLKSIAASLERIAECKEKKIKIELDRNEHISKLTDVVERLITSLINK